MAKYCDNCGSNVFSGKCVRCHEELYILDQYDELDINRPDDNTDFMKKVYSQQKETARKTKDDLGWRNEGMGVDYEY